MRMRGKFLLHFFGQSALVILLMSVLAVASFFYLDWRFSEAEANAGLTKATADSFEAWLDKNEDGTWDVDEFLKMSVRKQKGWSQIINDNEKRTTRTECRKTSRAITAEKISYPFTSTGILTTTS